MEATAAATASFEMGEFEEVRVEHGISGNRETGTG